MEDHFNLWSEIIMSVFLTGERLIFLIGFPAVILLMLYVSALLGMKWQGALLETTLHRYLNNKPLGIKLITSALLGAVTPFCSCTTVPGVTAILQFRFGLAPAVTFLLASPLIDPVGTLLLFYLFGLKLTTVYITGTFITAVLGGWLIGCLCSERDINPVIYFASAAADEEVSWKMAAVQAWSYIRHFWWVILASAVVGFVLNDLVPSNLIFSLTKDLNFLAVPIGAVLGTIIYAHPAILLPVGKALLVKGLAPGVVLSFMAAAAGISPPELVLLRRIFSPKLLTAYVTVTLILISLMGYIADLIGR